MDPVVKPHMLQDAQVSRFPAPLEQCCVSGDDGRVVVVRLQSLPRRPIVQPMWNGRPDLVGAVASRVIDLAVARAMGLEHRDVGTGVANGLRYGVGQLDGVVKRIVEIRVTARTVVGVHGGGV